MVKTFVCVFIAKAIDLWLIQPFTLFTYFFFLFSQCLEVPLDLDSSTKPLLLLPLQLLNEFRLCSWRFSLSTMCSILRSSCDEHSSNQWRALKRLALEWSSGGLANAVTSSLLNPMDVSKTRMQVEGLHNRNLTNRGLVGTMTVLYREGGIVGLWRPGLTASIARELLYSGPRAGFYVPVRNSINSLLGFPEGQHQHYHVVVKIVAALSTGGLFHSHVFLLHLSLICWLLPFPLCLLLL